jgi:hypothetical protein|tara:strand:- start:160 stop:831 length:672 start_codon:yes stop_codon:yes gene_type:complete
MLYGKSHMSPTVTSLWVKMRFSRLHCVLFLLLVSSLGFSSSQSFPIGVGESANDGCLCHGSASNSSESSLVGLPTTFESNQSFNLTLVIESNIAAQSNTSQGGFRLLVSGGTIEFSNPNEAQELDGGWTHTGEGNSQRAWNFTWVAPQENTSTVEFIVFGNAVNGNGNSMGDAWNSYGVTIPGSSFDGTLIQPDVDQSYSITDFSLIIGGLIAILVCLYIVVK